MRNYIGQTLVLGVALLVSLGRPGAAFAEDVMDQWERTGPTYAVADTVIAPAPLPALTTSDRSTERSHTESATDPLALWVRQSPATDTQVSQPPAPQPTFNSHESTSRGNRYQGWSTSPLDQFVR